MAKKNAKKTVERAKALEKNGNGTQLIRIAKAKNKAPKSVKQIKNSTEMVLQKEDKIGERWKEYFHKLLNGENLRKKYEDGETNKGMVETISKKILRGLKKTNKINKKARRWAIYL